MRSILKLFENEARRSEWMQAQFLNGATIFHARFIVEESEEGRRFMCRVLTCDRDADNLRGHEFYSIDTSARNCLNRISYEALIRLRAQIRR